jgi:hypothetical protein
MSAGETKLTRGKRNEAIKMWLMMSFYVYSPPPPIPGRTCEVQVTLYPECGTWLGLQPTSSVCRVEVLK